jgi:hypothetical protein
MARGGAGALSGDGWILSWGGVGDWGVRGVCVVGACAVSGRRNRRIPGGTTYNRLGRRLWAPNLLDGTSLGGATEKLGV